MSHFLAFDLGAESGRAMLGRLEQSRLELEELHRFPNQPVRLPDGLYWDSLRLFHEIREGLRVAGRERKLHLDGIGVDTWGVDFGLVDEAGRLVDAPRHYRTPATTACSSALSKPCRASASSSSPAFNSCSSTRSTSFTPPSSKARRA
jgi:rhamnulokinase